MAPPAAVVAAGGAAATAAGGEARPQEQQGFGKSIQGIIRIAIFWYFASKFFSPKTPPPTGFEPAVQISNLFPKAEPLDMWFYLSENETFKDFASEGALVWHETNIPYAVWGPESTRSLSLKYYPSEALKHNGSLYAHIFFARSGYPADPMDPEYQPLTAFGRTYPVVTYLPKSKADKKRSLLADSEDKGELATEVVEDAQADQKDDGPVEWISYWKPNITINLVDDFTKYTYKAVPPNIAPWGYYPTIFFNEFWLLKDKLIPINETVTELPFHLEVGPISMTKWQLFLQIDQSFQIHRSYGSMLEGEADELKRVFLEGNPYLLMITMVVSLLHSVFDFLAFKNDIQFWNKNKSMEGLSAKSVVVSFFSQLIVFLYLLDNDTSWMILASSGVGCCIEFWKIGKAMHIEVDRSGSIPRLRFRDRDSYSGNKTKEYDDLAMKYLSYVLFLLVACSSAYSLKYERHKSWSLVNFKSLPSSFPFSSIIVSLRTKHLLPAAVGSSCRWLMQMQVGDLREHGFIMMCPQLFINYKLQSVAHLPWRQMTYKFLNTIIDDLFAFVIKMPLLHRLSVFRDDVIFLIYLYQRWVYPVDRKRVNEFGFAGEDVDQASGSTDLTTVNEEEKKTK
uniref:Uncharacterized protein n=1 Tax=Daucus carota subsp. sativus TaxID=79200 RepID=A0A161WQE3_DAUCS